MVIHTTSATSLHKRTPNLSTPGEAHESRQEPSTLPILKLHSPIDSVGTQLHHQRADLRQRRLPRLRPRPRRRQRPPRRDAESCVARVRPRRVSGHVRGHGRGSVVRGRGGSGGDGGLHGGRVAAARRVLADAVGRVVDAAGDGPRIPFVPAQADVARVAIGGRDAEVLQIQGRRRRVGRTDRSGIAPAVEPLRVVARRRVALSTAPHGVVLEGGAGRRRSEGRHAKRRGAHGRHR
mmetsp:Transcript_36795/g.78442  ORF Transcript_36795/g.78442 Transcript_36795/m.78442 type:complete len:236 (-) Transcript_36795:2418-3125(-)